MNDYSWITGKHDETGAMRYYREYLPKPKPSVAHRIVYALMLVSIVGVLFAVTGCTYAKIEGPEYQATILTFTPTGNSTQFEGALTGKGRVSLNRELGGAEGVIGEVGEIVRPLRSNEL
jgi:hypothetical protein